MQKEAEAKQLSSTAAPDGARQGTLAPSPTAWHLRKSFSTDIADYTFKINTESKHAQPAFLPPRTPCLNRASSSPRQSYQQEREHTA